MAENKFIKHLKGEQTAGSLVEIKNQNTPASFGNMPQGTSDSNVKYSDVRGDVTVVANGTTAWKLNDSALTLAPIVNGDGTDYTSTYDVSGAGLWVNSTYTFPSTGDPNHPVAMIFNPNTKWVLKLCGDNLIVNNGETLELNVIITIGTSNIISKQFTIKEQANQFCKELVIDFDESNASMIKASGLATLQLQVLCGTADASARIYNGMTTLTVLQRKVDAAVVSGTFANVEEVMRDGLLPNDYFSNAAYIAQITDGDTAYAVFQRDGDDVALAGWAQPIPDQTGNSGKFLTTDGSLMSWAQLTISDVDGLSTELGNLQDQIDDLSGRGRYLSIWNCTTGLAETNPPTSPYTYQSGDYFIVGAVGATNYKPDGSSYTTGVASTTIETAEVKVDDLYIYDGTNWKLLASSQRTYTFAGIAGSPYDNTNLGNALNTKVDANAAITGATKCKITYDSKGLVTAGADLAEGDIPSLHLSKISDVTASASEVNVLDGITASTSELNILDGITASTSELNVLDGITATTTELNYTDGVTSNIQTQLDGKQATLVSGTNIKTINSGSILGSGNIDVLVNEATPASSLGIGYTTINTTYTDSINIGNGAQVGANNALALGAFASAEGQDSIAIYSSTGTAHRARTTHTGNIAIGYNALAINAPYTIAIGYNAFAQATNAIQLGTGNNASSNTLQVASYKLLNTSTGLIPSARLADQTSATQGQVLSLDANLDAEWTTPTTVNDATLTIQKNGSDVATFTANSSTNTTANIVVPTDTSDLTNGAGFVTSLSDLGVTATASELNVLDGITASTTELNYVDGVTSSIQTQIDSKPASTNRVNGAPLSNTASVFYGTSTTAAATTEKEVSIPSITTLDTGTIIIVQPTKTSTVANSTIKLNSFAAYPMRYNNAAITTSTDSVVWNQNYPSTFVFDGTYWVFAGHGLDSNTTYTINYSIDAGQYTAGVGSYAVSRYSIIAQKPDGTWEKITATNAAYSTGTTKSVNTTGFILNQLRFYNSTTNISTGGQFSSVYEKSASVDMRYSTNCGGTTTWAVGDYIYLVGTIGADGLFYFDTTTWWTNTLPSTNDGKLYVRLGLALAANGYSISFFSDRPVFYHDGIKLCEYKVADNKQDVISDLATIRSGASAGATAVQPGDLAAVATSGSYNDLLNKPTIPAAQVNSDWNAVSGVAQILNKPTLAAVATSGLYSDLTGTPTIPTVNDATLTIQKNGTNVATFTANSSTNATANISVPTDTGDLTNGAGFITGITSSDVTNALGYTPYNDANPNGYTSNVGTVTSVNSVSPDGSGNVSLTIPTVNDATITITQGGVTKGSFTLNQASGDTIALDAGGGGSVDIDNSTITKNGDDELQAVATINANTAVGATNPVYDWVGTLAEYTSQDVATNHPDWLCFITDDTPTPPAHEVIDFQAPTAQNNYTWYRKYADGWVEQGGTVENNSSASTTINLPITMSDTHYTVVLGGKYDNNSTIAMFNSKSTNSFVVTCQNYNHTDAARDFDWQVSGMAA